MIFNKTFREKRMIAKKQSCADSFFKKTSFFTLMTAVMLLVACGRTAIEVPEKRARESQAISDEEKQEVLPEEKDFRGWIHSVSLRPPQVNNESTLSVSTDWGPEGKPGVMLRYQWFVNGKKILSEASARLNLSKFRSGARVYAVAHLVRNDGKIIASRRSRSSVIQNRPPRLDADLKEMKEEDGYLIGAIAASDPDGDAFTMRLVDGPNGLMIDSDGSVRWPLSKVRPGKYQMTLELEDERGLGLLGTLLFSMDREREG